MLAPQTLKELSDILRKEFGADLTDVEVFQVGTNLVDLFSNLHEMDRKDLEKKVKGEVDKNENEKTELLPTV